jgi:phosphonate transport system permease protein
MSSGAADALLTVDVGSRQSWTGRSGRGQRRLLAVAVLVGLSWALWGAGLGRSPLLNVAGWPQLRGFLVAVASPEASPAFLRVVAEASLVTIGYAVLGTALSLVIGVAGGFVVSQTFWRGGRRRHGRLGWVLSRTVLAVPRGLHEAVWALLLVNILGLNPLVAVLAIGLPYGAITAKVYADLLDEVPRAPYQALLAGGASRGQALLQGLLPLAAMDLLSYAFYRLECSVRSAVVLGIVGAGGLGFQLDLSFSALRYGEMWTVIFALVVLCAAADLASSGLRGRLARPRGRSRRDSSGGLRPRRDPVVPIAVVACLLLAGWSWRYLGVQPATLWSPRTATQIRSVLTAAWPPVLDGRALAELWRLSVQTFQMSLLAMVLATVAGLVVAVVAARVPSAGVGRRAAELLARGLLLLCRAVPPPVWALLVLFVLYPGLLPGAVALAAYNAGVLGRLMAEAQESLPAGPARALRVQGAGRGGAWLYATLPRVLPKDLAYGLYRWEVATRETVIVGLVGAGGLGQLLAFQTAGFNWPAVTATLLALIVLTLVVDLLSTLARRACR